jgi:membrane protease YdiL (CAAX protease family)
MSQIYKNSEGFTYKYPENHPIVSLIYLLMLIVGSSLIFTLLAFVIGYSLYGPGLLDNLASLMTGTTDTGLRFLKLFQTLSSIGTFVVPALLLKYIERNRTQYLDFSIPNPQRLMIIAVVIMLVSGPFLELTSIINQQMQLPGFLSEMESWMKAKELEMAQLTEKLLVTSTISGLMFNLFMIAVLPAIGEELVFRGCLQPIFHRWTNNIHLAIWISAIIFSAIHIQFYGFIPRMLMGAVFGYMFYWGKSIWLPIIAHFINNATAVIYTFVMLKQGKSFEEINNEGVPHWSLYILSTFFLAFLIYRFWKLSREQNIKTNTIQNLS